MNNGWNTDKLDSLISVLGEINRLDYEVENCVRGVYTGACTYEELGRYIQELGNQLIQEGSYIEEEVEEDEEEE